MFEIINSTASYTDVLIGDNKEQSRDVGAPNDHHLHFLPKENTNASSHEKSKNKNHNRIERLAVSIKNTQNKIESK